MISETRTGTVPQCHRRLCFILAFCFWLTGNATAEPTAAPVKSNRANQSISTVNQSGGQNIIAGGDVHVGPKRRDITAEKERIMLPTLKAGPKGKVKLIGSLTDSEVAAFVKQLDGILKRAGFDVTFQLAIVFAPNGGPPIGLHFVVKDRESVPPYLQTVGDALLQAGFDVSGKLELNAERPADTLVIIVGANPANQ